MSSVRVNPFMNSAYKSGAVDENVDTTFVTRSTRYGVSAARADVRLVDMDCKDAIVLFCTLAAFDMVDAAVCNLDDMVDSSDSLLRCCKLSSKYRLSSLAKSGIWYGCMLSSL
jgi:hypothetical protein